MSKVTHTKTSTASKEASAGISKCIALHGGQNKSKPDPACAAIELNEVDFSYDKQPFIEQLSLTIPRSGITSIVGPNGCGKSTLFKMIDGLIKPQAGHVLINGTSTFAMSGKERARQLALLTQGSRPPAMLVETLVACGRYPYQGHLHQLNATDKQQIEEAMTLTGVEKFRHHDVRYLSGGERQRAFIAMTLAQDTSIIALDEPTTYLDVHACHEVMQLAQNLSEQENKTIVMVLHDIDLALRYSDNLIVMQRGCCLSAGSVEEVLESKAIDTAFKVEVQQVEVNGKTAFTLFPR